MFENLKKGMVSLGLAENEESVPPPAALPPTPSTPPGAPNALVTRECIADTNRSDKYDESAKAALAEVFQNTNVRLIPELQSLLATLEAAIPVEALRFQTALKIFSSKGTPIAAILSEYDVYAGALEEKNRVFSKEIQDQFEARVGSKIKAVEGYDAQIANLQKQVTELSAQRETDRAGIAEAKSKLELLQQRFGVQYNATRVRVEQQKAQVAEHGKGL
jgi:hypothetical protein